nr:unnamed protein product [Digitaria exilis]
MSPPPSLMSSHLQHHDRVELFHLNDRDVGPEEKRRQKGLSLSLSFSFSTALLALRHQASCTQTQLLAPEIQSDSTRAARIHPRLRSWHQKSIRAQNNETETSKALHAMQDAMDGCSTLLPPIIAVALD